MKIILIILVLFSALILLKLIRSKLKGVYYILLILALPLVILGVTGSYKYLDDQLLLMNLFILFVSAITLISIFRILKFHLNKSKLLFARIKNSIIFQKWLEPIVIVTYIIVQVATIWGGEKFFIIQ